MATNTIRRRDTNYFEKFNVSSSSWDILAHWSFNSTGMSLLVESNEPSDVVQYSFDGKNVHGDLTPGMPSQGIVFDNRIANKIWFRRASPGRAVLVRVEAWRHNA